MQVSAAPALAPIQTPSIVKPTATAVDEQGETQQKEQQPSASQSTKAQIASTLTEQEVKQVQELKARDREVRAHEAAHLAAAGSLATGVSFTYQRGPDGVQYAVGGEVGIDTSPVAGDPEATLAKAQRIRAAALAPAEPSAQDLRVAAQAAQLAVQARAEIGQQQRAESEETSEAIEEVRDSAASDSTEETGDSTQPDETNNDIAARQAQIFADNDAAVNGDRPEAILDLIA
jgi:hypothetical protein